MLDLIKEFMKQKRFAIIGATDNPKKYGYQIFKNLKDRKYEIYPVNPRLNEIEGIKCYANLADTFIKQAREQNYKHFKQSLQKYLIFNGESQTFVDTLNLSLSKKLEELYASSHEKLLNDVILLKTCNKLINYLTTENRRQPSHLKF